MLYLYKIYGSRVNASALLYIKSELMVHWALMDIELHLKDYLQVLTKGH